MDIRENLRKLRRGQSNRAVERDTGIHRKTVARYRAWAQEQGLLEGPLPSLSGLQRLLEETWLRPAPPQNISSVHRFVRKLEPSVPNVNAFSCFKGVPERVMIDNLKAGIIRACWEDPQVQQSYRECAEHYGFLIAPCCPHTPEHKGKVEKGGVLS
jgi:transposase